MSRARELVLGRCGKLEGDLDGLRGDITGIRGELDRARAHGIRALRRWSAGGRVFAARERRRCLQLVCPLDWGRITADRGGSRRAAHDVHPLAGPQPPVGDTSWLCAMRSGLNRGDARRPGVCSIVLWLASGRPGALRQHRGRRAAAG